MLQIILFIGIFLTGLAVGSFLNCVIYRLEKGKSFLKGRSYCPHCQHQLGWPDLIPLISFVWLGGRCQYCHQKISWQYPLVELATGTIFLLTLIFTITNSYTYAYLLLIYSFLIVIFVYDLKHYIIPDQVIYPAIVITIFYQWFRIWNFGHWNLLCVNSGLGIWNLGLGILPTVFFLAIVLFSRGRWMGGGDVKLVFLMGLLLGFPEILVALFLAFVLGGIIGIGLIIAGKKTLKSEVPFGPFLVTGTFLALFCGQQLINWYVQIIYPSLLFIK